MTLKSSLHENLSALGLDLPTWPDESHLNKSMDTWISVGNYIAIIIKTWTLIIGTEKTSKKIFINNLINDLSSSNDGTSWDNVLMTLIIPLVQNLRPYEIKVSNINLALQSHELTSGQLFGITLYLAELKHLDLSIQGLKLLAERNCITSHEEALQITAMVVSKYCKSNFNNTKSYSPKTIAREVSDHKRINELMLELIRTNQLNESNIEIHASQVFINQLISLKISDQEEENNKNGVDWYVKKAQDLISLSQSDEACKIIETGLKLFPDNLVILCNATDIYRNSGNYSKSLVISQKILDMHPQDWNGYVRAAQDLISLSRSDEACKIIEIGLKLFPDKLVVLSNATDIYHRSGNLEIALQISYKILSIYPSHPEGYLLISRYLNLLFQFPESINVAEKGLQMFPDNLDINCIMIDSYLGAGNYQSALQKTHKLLLKFPENKVLIMHGIRVYRYTSDFELMSKLIQQIIDKPESTLLGLDLITNLYTELWDFEKVLNIIEELVYNKSSIFWIKYGIDLIKACNRNPLSFNSNFAVQCQQQLEKWFKYHNLYDSKDSKTIYFLIEYFVETREYSNLLDYIKGVDYKGCRDISLLLKIFEISFIIQSSTNRSELVSQIYELLPSCMPERIEKTTLYLLSFYSIDKNLDYLTSFNSLQDEKTTITRDLATIFSSDMTSKALLPIDESHIDQNILSTLQHLKNDNYCMNNVVLSLSGQIELISPLIINNLRNDDPYSSTKPDLIIVEDSISILMEYICKKWNILCIPAYILFPILVKNNINLQCTNLIRHSFNITNFSGWENFIKSEQDWYYADCLRNQSRVVHDYHDSRIINFIAPYLSRQNSVLNYPVDQKIINADEFRMWYREISEFPLPTDKEFTTVLSEYKEIQSNDLVIFQRYYGKSFYMFKSSDKMKDFARINYNKLVSRFSDFGNVFIVEDYRCNQYFTELLASYFSKIRQTKIIRGNNLCMPCEYFFQKANCPLDINVFSYSSGTALSLGLLGVKTQNIFYDVYDKELGDYFVNPNAIDFINEEAIYYKNTIGFIESNKVET